MGRRHHLGGNPRPKLRRALALLLGGLLGLLAVAHAGEGPPPRGPAKKTEPVPDARLLAELELLQNLDLLRQLDVLRKVDAEASGAGRRDIRAEKGKP